MGTKIELPNNKMRIDLHCHSEASWDCITPIEDIAQKCLDENIKVQAVTDHNEIKGAVALKNFVREKELPIKVIIGEEISTTEGEIIGLFLTKKIPSGLSPEETVKEIRRQNGLVLLPHGFDPLKRYRLKPKAVMRIKDSVDIVEGFNARISFQRYNNVAIKWAKAHNKELSAGTDAHTLKDVGTAWVETELREIQEPADLLLALKEGQIEGLWVHPWKAFAYKMWDFARKKFNL